MHDWRGGHGVEGKEEETTTCWSSQHCSDECCCWCCCDAELECDCASHHLLNTFTSVA